MHRELSLSTAGAYIRKSQEVEGRGFFPSLLRLLGGMTPELNQPRLLRVQCQTVFPEPLW